MSKRKRKSLGKAFGLPVVKVETLTREQSARKFILLNGHHRIAARKAGRHV